METRKNTTEIATAAQRKLPRPATAGDRLSSLPDEILCHILSFLPTKYAVGTSGLGRRWKGLWTGLDKLDLDNKGDYNLFEYGGASRNEFHKRRALEFCRFVRVLREHKDLHSLRRLRIHFAMWAKYPMGEATPNILLRMGSSASSRLEKLDLSNVGSTSETFQRLKLLKVLKLERVTLTETTATKGSVILPSVKILQIVSVQITDFKLLSNLISGCPVLETLSVEHCEFSNREKNAIVTASLPYLKNLTIVGHAYRLCPMGIEAPSLEQLELRHFDALQLVGGGTSSGSSPLPCLHSAQLHIGHTDISKPDLIRLLDQISGAKEMWLSWRTLSVLIGDEEDDDVQLSILPNLTRLTIELGRSLSHLHFFLKAAPKLQHLCIDLEFQDEPEDETEWDESEIPARTPECLLSSLEEIHISNVRTDGGDVDMVSYLLEAGAVLKKVNVHAAYDKHDRDYDDDDDETYREDPTKRLRKVMRRSRACEVRVIDGHYGRVVRLDSDYGDETDKEDDDDDSDSEG